METLEQVADRIVHPETVTYRRADELFTGLEIETLHGWREVTKVDRVRSTIRVSYRRVQVILEDDQCLMFAPGQIFRSRDGKATCR